MFISIRHSPINGINDLFANPPFVLVDTLFTCPLNGGMMPDSKETICGAIVIYLRGKYSIAKNIARIYWWGGYISLSGGLRQDKDFIDTKFPELQYGKKFFGCVIRELQNVEAAKKRHV